MAPLLILIYKLKKGDLFFFSSWAESHPRCGASQYPSNMHTVIGHSMSKGIKKMSKVFTGCCLLLPLIILIKL